MKRDLQTKKKCMDFFYNVQKLIPNISSFLFRFKVWLMLLLASLKRLKSLVSHVRKKLISWKEELWQHFRMKHKNKFYWSEKSIHLTISLPPHFNIEVF